MAETKQPRDEKMNRLYITRDGEETAKLTPDVASVIWEVIATGERVQLDLSDLFPQGMPEPCVGLCAAAFGVNTAVGNTVGNTRDTTEMVRRLRDRASAISEGEWASGREGGPRMRFVLEAWRQSLEARGHKLSDEQVEAMRQEVVKGNLSTKEILADDHVRAQYDANEVERARALAEASKAKLAAKPAAEIDPRLLPK